MDKMIILKLFLGILLLLLGLVYFYKPNLVLNINKVAKEVFFNDRRILLERKKLAILFFLISFIFLYMGVTNLTKYPEKLDGTLRLLGFNKIKYSMYLAMQDYCAGKYSIALIKYKDILKNNPGDLKVLKRIAYTYDAMGQKRKANALWHSLLRLYPKDKEIKAQIKKLNN